MADYKYYTNNRNKVVAVSTYAGKPVKGVATCHPSDTFSIEKGKELAAARCAEKIAEKRFKRAKRKFKEAEKAMIEARRHHTKMANCTINAEDAFILAGEHVKKLLEEI